MSIEQPPKPSARSRIARLVAELPNGSFALVMATGIVSIAAALFGFGRIAASLLALNALFFVTLWALTLTRLFYCRSAVTGELADHRQAPGFLTIVAGTNVLGEQVSVLAGQQQVAAALWLLGSALWVGLLYSVFAAITTRSGKPPLKDGLDGSWLLVVVGTESAAILGVQIAGAFSSSFVVVATSLSFYLLGGAFYMMIITLILYRWLFEPMRPAEFTASYWINMGAAAITALAGTRLAAGLALYPTLLAARGFVVGETVLFWSVASWWIPLLAIMTAWRHVAGHERPAYRFEYWSMVFPLGMYAAATVGVARLIGGESLLSVARFFLWVAIAAWCATSFGMVRQLLGFCRGWARR